MYIHICMHIYIYNIYIYTHIYTYIQMYILLPHAYTSSQQVVFCALDLFMQDTLCKNVDAVKRETGARYRL